MRQPRREVVSLRFREARFTALAGSLRGAQAQGAPVTVDVDTITTEDDEEIEDIILRGAKVLSSEGDAQEMTPVS